MATRILVLDNIRSLHNVGSLARSADGFGFETILTIGITPHLEQPSDVRLPHVISKAEKSISKTALGAEKLLTQHFANAGACKDYLQRNAYQIVALEQHPAAQTVEQGDYSQRLALVVGNEIHGVSDSFLSDHAVNKVEISMHGSKESLNVSNAGAVAMYVISQKLLE